LPAGQARPPPAAKVKWPRTLAIEARAVSPRSDWLERALIPFKEGQMAVAQQEARQEQTADANAMAQTYADVARRASKLLGDHLERQIKHGAAAPEDELGIARAFMDMTAKMFANPYQLAQAQINLGWQYFSLWQHAMLRLMGIKAEPVAEPASGDNRFKDAQWEEHFLFDFIKQSYLISARHIHDVVSNVEGLPEISRKKVNFFTRQFIDAFSPTNFALTNPEVLRETMKSHGQNLVKGFSNLLRDLEEGDGQLRVKMTDPSAFELGRNVATTPGKVIFQNELLQLLQFNPTTAEQFKQPLLIMPPWINNTTSSPAREEFLHQWPPTKDIASSRFMGEPVEKLAEKDFEDYLNEAPWLRSMRYAADWR